MNTYFVVDDHYCDSREEALKELSGFTKEKETFAVLEMERTKVTRRSAAGNILTEIVKGSLEKVPRIISTEKLSAIFYVRAIGGPFGPRYVGEFSTSEEAEQKRSKEQAEADARALLTEADIKEVHVPTLADILERDEAKIDELRNRLSKASQSVTTLLKQANAPEAGAAGLAKEITSLEGQITSLEGQLALLKDQLAARKQFDEDHETELQELKLAEQASQAYYASIGWDKFAEEAREKLGEDHNCWPGDRCRGDDECTYEPDEDEIEEYVFDNADDFELDLDPDSEEAKALLFPMERAAEA